MKCKNKKVLFIYLFLTTLSLRLAYIQYLLKHLYYQKISFKQNGSKIYTKYSRFTVVSATLKVLKSIFQRKLLLFEYIYNIHLLLLLFNYIYKIPAHCLWWKPKNIYWNTIKMQKTIKVKLSYQTAFRNSAFPLVNGLTKNVLCMNTK